MPLKTVAFQAAPRAYIHCQGRRRSSDDDGGIRPGLTESAFDEEISSFRERQRFEIYLHAACSSLTNASIVPNRSTA